MANEDGHTRVVAMDAQALQAFRAEVIAQKNLPTIPTVLARIVRLTDGEGGNSRELVDVVEHDQALTGRILRLANSAFFGQTRRVATIPRAVVLLGFSTVRNLALGVKVWETLGNGLSRGHLETLWAHGVTVAVASKWLTARLRAGDPDEAFTAGLLHDIGRLVMAVRLGDVYWSTLTVAPPDQPVAAVESGTFGVDHAEVGGWLLDAWSLPPGIVEAVRQHHEDGARAGLPGVVATGNHLVGWTDMSSGTCRPEAEAVMAPLAERGITPEAWAQMIAGVSAEGLLALNG